MQYSNQYIHMHTHTCRFYFLSFNEEKFTNKKGYNVKI